MPEVFDFIPEFIDFSKMLTEPLAWQVAHGEVFSVDNMSDDELRQSIVDDVLAVTIWEKQMDQKVDFTVDTLCRFLSVEQKTRVQEVMKHPFIWGLFNPDLKDNIRILDDKAVLQAAMNYCGVWFTGYDTPDGIIRIDRHALQEAMDNNGGIDNLVNGLVMDLTATHSGTTTVN